jgi:SRSO17 transposase
VKAFLNGLFLADHRNLQQMAESQDGIDRQNLQYLLSEAVWDHEKVQDHIAQDVGRILGGHEESMLLLDESGMSKKGKCSAGVARQWNGRLGKVDNCQVGVFAALCRGSAAALVQAQMYMPKEWTGDVKRCAKAGVPEDKMKFRSKSAICLEMVARTRKLGVRFSWVGADAGYGKEPEFLRKLDDMGERFMVDLHSNQMIYLENPEPHVPSAEGVRGRKPTRLQTEGKAITIQSWASTQPENAWQEVAVRHTTKGILRVKVLRRMVWLWNHIEEKPRKWTILVIKELDNPDEVSYSVTNSSEDVALHVVVQAQRQRFWIENAFGDGKSELGMDDYEVRSWVGWHRHMTLCMLGQLFITEEKLTERNEIPMLSTRDLCTILFSLLTDPDRSFDRTCKIIEERQRQRWKSQVIYCKKRNESPRWASYGEPGL